jgi:hypothetical protein
LWHNKGMSNLEIFKKVAKKELFLEKKILKSS